MRQKLMTGLTAIGFLVVLIGCAAAETENTVKVIGTLTAGLVMMEIGYQKGWKEID